MLLKATGIERAYGGRRVLRGADLQIAPGERVGLVGVNGCGKSTLLKIVAGVEEPDFGEVVRPASLSLLRQEPRLPGTTVGEAVDEAVSWHHDLLTGYEKALADGDFELSETLQSRLDLAGWTIDHRVDALLDKLDAPPREAPLAPLSGGEKRRVALVRALLGQPDVLMLDEPTNHLDADAIEWLQGQLERWPGAVLFVTHDRYLLEAVATRIVEVDDGICVSFPGSYGDYLIESAERQAVLQRTEDSRLSYIAREAEWAARSPAARSTKQKARLQRLEALQGQRKLSKQATFSLDFSTGVKTGTTAFEGRGISKAFGDRVLMEDLDLSLVRGERLGILGPNGAGKSTLLRILSGDLTPDGGSVVFGGGVKVAVLDQHRSGLQDGDTVWEAAAGGNNWVTVGDQPVHVTGFLARFLFPREALDRKVEILSGGERARLLLAKLLLQGANFLLLDEPSNDLDLLTLRVLEEALLGFDGTAVVITHDRAFLDRVCTRILAFDGLGGVESYADRSQYLKDRERKERALGSAAKAERDADRAERDAAAPAAPEPALKPLTFAERKELEKAPATIERLEQESAMLTERLSDPELWKDAEAGLGVQQRIDGIGKELEGLYARWEELEARA